MMLPDFTAFEPLNRLRRLMNAPLQENFSFGHTVRGLTHEDLDRALEAIGVLPDGTLTYKNRRVLLYIRDKRAFLNQKLPKFHFMNCKKLEEMRGRGRFERYVISTRTDGKFKMNFIYDSGSKASICELKVCKLCLGDLPYKGYGQGDHKRDKEIYRAFALEEYFAVYPKNLLTVLPQHTDDSAPLNDYGIGFREISARYRAKNGWICENEKCRIDLSHPSHRKYLHTHHLNAQKYDDRRENHKALCIRCHAEEPMHEHLKNSPDYTEFMAIYFRIPRATRCR
jgi:hypothetical protein